MAEGSGDHFRIDGIGGDNDFDERLAGRLAGAQVVEIGGSQLPDVANAWPDLAALF